MAVVHFLVVVDLVFSYKLIEFARLVLIDNSFSVGCKLDMMDWFVKLCTSKFEYGNQIRTLLEKDKSSFRKLCSLLATDVEKSRCTDCLKVFFGPRRLKEFEVSSHLKQSVLSINTSKTKDGLGNSNRAKYVKEQYMMKSLRNFSQNQKHSPVKGNTSP